MKLAEEEIEKFPEEKPTSESYRKLCAKLLSQFRRWLGSGRYQDDLLSSHRGLTVVISLIQSH